MDPSENPYFSKVQHRVLRYVTWTLVFLGLLAWFVQGANRPLDPIVSPALILGPLAVRRLLA